MSLNIDIKMIRSSISSGRVWQTALLSYLQCRVSKENTSGTLPKLLPDQRGLTGWCRGWFCPLLSLAFDPSQLPSDFWPPFLSRKIRWTVWNVVVLQVFSKVGWCSTCFATQWQKLCCSAAAHGSYYAARALCTVRCCSEGHCETLVSLLQGLRVLQQQRQPCMYLMECVLLRRKFIQSTILDLSK